MQTSSSETSTLTSKMRYQIGNYVCPLCHMVFENCYALEGHQNAHRPKRFTSSSNSSVEDSDDALNTASLKGYKARGFLKVKGKADDNDDKKSKADITFKSNDADSETTITDPMVKESRKVDDAGYDGDVEVSSKRIMNFEEYSSTKDLDLELRLGFSVSD